MKHNLLVEKIFSVHTRSGPEKFSLPGVLAALARDEILTFDQIRMHQRQAWFCFLVQLASLTDISPEVTGEEEWKDALMELADGEESMWCLVVDDLSKPAFMQPPVPEGSWVDYITKGTKIKKPKAPLRTPDELDILVTAKNHDLKVNRIINPEVEHWVFSLVVLQTMEGQMGRGNYGSIRMNGGYGSRVFVTTKNGNKATIWQAEVGKLKEAFHETSDKFSLRVTGHSLLWSIPWDGKSQISFQDCRPFFLEVIRRIRITISNNNLFCRVAASKSRRVKVPSSNENGFVDDPWTPVSVIKTGTHKGKVGSFGMTLRGFDYEVIHKILWDYDDPISISPKNCSALFCMALTRGQGITQGYHERVIPIPATIQSLFKKPDLNQKIAKRSLNQIEIGNEFINILKEGIRKLLNGGKESKNPQSKYFEKMTQNSKEWIRGFRQSADREFFVHLWEHIDSTSEEMQISWIKKCDEWARHQLNLAELSVSYPGVRKYRSIAAAQSIYDFRYKTKYGHFFEVNYV